MSARSLALIAGFLWVLGPHGVYAQAPTILSGSGVLIPVGGPASLPDESTPASRERPDGAPQETAPQPAPPAERDIFPSQGFIIAGYGSAGYSVADLEGTTPNDFTASLSPLFLFQIADRFLFEAEVEFELEEGVTRTGLEYAQIDYSLSNNLQLAAGKFLLPFNAFSERFHPTWINKFASPPPLYGHGTGSGPAPPLLPLLSDVGAQIRGTFNVGRFGFATGTVFVTQGPSVEEEEHGEEEGEGENGHAEFEVPEVVFGRNFEDPNEGKMVGGRVGSGIALYFEINLSAMTSGYDEEGRLRFSAIGAHVEGRYRHLELHGEWIRTAQDVAPPEHGARVEVLSRQGYFFQAGYRLDRWEPLVRWTQLFSGEFEGETAVAAGQQLALGLARWLRPNLVLKAEYLMNREDADLENNRFALQWAFGF